MVEKASPSPIDQTKHRKRQSRNSEFGCREQYNIVAADLTEFRGFIINVVIDVFSRRAWIDQVNSKKPEDIKNSFQKILGEMEKTPKLLTVTITLP